MMQPVKIVESNKPVAVMSMAGLIASAAAYVLSLRLFTIVYHVASGLVLLTIFVTAYAILRWCHWIRAPLNGVRAIFGCVSVVIGYPVCVSVFEWGSNGIDRLAPTVPVFLSGFLASSIAGLLAAAIAWVATGTFVGRFKLATLMHFGFGSIVASLASCFASSYATRHLDLGPAIIVLLFPGVLYAVGMTLFGAAFGFALGEQASLHKHGGEEIQPIKTSESLS